MHWVHCGSKCSLFCVNFYLKKRGASGEPCGTLRKLSCPSQLSENCVLHLTAKLLTSTTIFSQTSICFSLALPWKSGEQVGANTSICKDWAQLSRNWHKCNGVKKKKEEAESNHAFSERCPQPCTCLQQSDTHKCLHEKLQHRSLPQNVTVGMQVGCL